MTKDGLTAKDLRFKPPCFSKEQLREVLKKRYGLCGCLKPLAGERDQNHLLTTDDGNKYVLKVAGANEAATVVDYQIKTLQYIERKNPALNIPRNINTLAGDDFTIIKSNTGQEHMMRLLSFLDGVPFGDDYSASNEVLYDVGRFQGQMCATLADFSHPSEGRFMPWDISQGLVLSPSLQSSYYGDVERLVLPLLDHFEKAVLPKLNSLRKQTIHNDTHEGNILRTSATCVDFYGVIDFGDIVYAPVIQDLSIPLTRFVGLSNDPIVSGSAYIKGFASAYPLTADELDILYDLLLLRSCLTIQLLDFRISNNDVNKEKLIKDYPSIVTMLENLLSYDKNKLTNAFHKAHEQGIKQ